MRTQKQKVWGIVFTSAGAIVLLIAMLAISKPPTVQAGTADKDSAGVKYPNIVGSALHDCKLCHINGIPPSLNSYGMDYKNNGRSFAAFGLIENLDSDRDGATNIQEIRALTFPGDPASFPTPTFTPSLTPTPSKTSTATFTPTHTFTSTPTHTLTITPSSSNTPTFTATNTATATSTRSSSAHVEVSIGGSNVGNYVVGTEQSIVDRYGINGGPALVSSTDDMEIFTSQRAIFGDSFNSIVGYPGNQLTTDYWFTSYDDTGMITYLVIGNPHSTLTAEVDVYIAGNKMNTAPYIITPGQRIFPRYGINDGPVHVVSTNGVNIFASERTKFGESFNEVVGYPGNQLTTDYWFTSYDDAGMITYLVIGNPHPTLTAEVDVYIAGNKMNTAPYIITPGQRIFPRYAINAGPIHVVSVNGVNVFTSERAKYLNSFNEILGLANNQLTTDYWFTSYDDVGMQTELVISVP